MISKEKCIHKTNKMKKKSFNLHHITCSTEMNPTADYLTNQPFIQHKLF